MVCTLCPRRCGAVRTRLQGNGFCGCPDTFLVSRCGLHPYEEPCICRGSGTGTIFFTGCNLHCVFCQNRWISQENNGINVSDETIIQMIHDLKDAGASHIELVTPTHYWHKIALLLERCHDEIGIPVVFNSGGYESEEMVSRLSGLVDIWMPDLKFFDGSLSKDLCGAGDYFDVASKAILKMTEQIPKPVYGTDGELLRGVIVRHLVLPGHRDDSINLLKALSEITDPTSVILSLMSQYTPDFYLGDEHPELKRRLTTFEYEKVVSCADSLGFAGYRQELASAKSSYTPDFEISQRQIKEKYHA